MSLFVQLLIKRQLSFLCHYHRGFIGSCLHVKYSIPATVLQLLTFGLADHDVTIFALTAVVKALHLDVVRRLGLELTNQVPEFEAQEKEAGKERQ